MSPQGTVVVRNRPSCPRDLLETSRKRLGDCALFSQGEANHEKTEGGEENSERHAEITEESRLVGDEGIAEDNDQGLGEEANECEGSPGGDQKIKDGPAWGEPCADDDDEQIQGQGGRRGEGDPVIGGTIAFRAEMLEPWRPVTPHEISLHSLCRSSSCCAHPCHGLCRWDQDWGSGRYFGSGLGPLDRARGGRPADRRVG